MPPSDQPLQPATFWILFALATGDKHGYAIMHETRKLSDGEFQMGPATLYTTIQRLVESAWIEEVPALKMAIRAAAITVSPNPANRPFITKSTAWNRLCVKPKPCACAPWSRDHDLKHPHLLVPAPLLSR